MIARRALRLGLVPFLMSFGHHHVTAQTKSATIDWDKAVEKANENRRFAIRRAAGNKVAQAGDEAVPAIRRYEAAKGRNNIVLTLVDSIARSKSDGPLIRSLLGDWARDLSFYWRSQAFTGLANRAIPELREEFQRALNDPSHLYRIAAAKGLLRLPTAILDRTLVLPLLRDADPRVRLRVGIELLQQSDAHGIGAVTGALQLSDRVFLDDAWGKRNATQAIRAIEKYVGHDFGYRAAEDDKARAQVLDKVRAYAVKHSPEDTPSYTPPTLEARTFVGGFEIRSCRLGDLFVQWTADGQVYFGLERGDQCQIPADHWADLSTPLTELSGTKIHGRVVCDYLRLRIEKPEVHRKCAPVSLPGPVTAWLLAFASGLDAAGRTDLSKSVTERLTQFVSDEKK